MTPRFRGAAPLLPALAAAASCEPVTAPPFPADAPPTAFHVRVAGFGFGSHDVTLRGDTLVVTRRTAVGADGAGASHVVPTRADWAAFWRAADDAGVRAWPRACVDTRIVDGGGYDLAIAYAGGRVASHGENAYPRRDGTCGPADGTAEYRTLLAAVAALIRRPFP